MLNRFTKALVEATDATEFPEPWGLVDPSGRMFPYGPPSMFVTVRRNGLTEWKKFLKENDLDPEVEFGRMALRAQLDVNAEMMAAGNRRGMRQLTKKQLARKIRTGLESEVEKAMATEISEDERLRRLDKFQEGICEILIEDWRSSDESSPLPEFSPDAAREMLFPEQAKDKHRGWSSFVPTPGFDPEKPWRIGFTDQRFASAEECTEAAGPDAEAFATSIAELGEGEILEASPKLKIIHESATTDVPFGGATAAEGLTFWLLTCAEYSEFYRTTRMETVRGN